MGALVPEPVLGPWACPRCLQSGLLPDVQALRRASGLRGSLALAEMGLLLKRVLCTLQTPAGHVLTRHPLSWLMRGAGTLRQQTWVGRDPSGHQC